MISDYKLDPSKLYIYSLKDDQYPYWHHNYMKNLYAGTIDAMMPKLEEFKRFIIMPAERDGEGTPLRAVKLGNAVYTWNDEVKAFSVKRQAQLRKQTGNADATLTNHPEAAEYLNQLKELGFKRSGKKDLRYGTGTSYTLKKNYGTLRNFPEYTWTASITRDVGTTSREDEATQAILNIFITNTDNKTVAANGYNLGWFSFGRTWGYGDRVEQMIRNFIDQQALDWDNRWQKERSIKDAIDNFKRQNHLEFSESRVFNSDFNTNYRNNDRLYSSFYNVDVTGMTPQEIDAKIQQTIDNANRMTNNPEAVRGNNERVENRIVDFLQDYLEGLQDYSFGESLEKEKTFEDMLEEIED